MRVLLATIIFSYIIVSCKTTKTSEYFEYEKENGLLEYYNSSNKSKPLIVVLPAVFNSILTTNQIETLAKKNRVVVVHFLSEKDKTRVHQIDGLTNRLNYYSTVLTKLLAEEKEKPIIIAEGINATITVQLGLNFNQPELILINAWYPTMQEILGVTCYANQDNGCDSLINYLSFSSITVANDLLSAVQDNGVDNLYGNYTLQTWKEFLLYDCDDLLVNYNTPLKWIYTNNTGLIYASKAKELEKSHGKRKNTQLLSLNAFIKKNNLLSN